ncbi:MAG: protein-L-isoaspartate(D-aspartate) O-methyltransferase [Bryobacteraceae bacterium]|nr:protein-L-isoaspartate(D-aspartate) O-methyltransferase [Bryobacteraceae bacterium]
MSPIALVALLGLWPAQDMYRQQREAMVREHIEARGISNARVLRAMRTVPRHEFVPAELRAQAYADHPLPIGHGQTISQPYIVAFMSDALDVKHTHKVLEIGAGSGYQAAVLALLAKHVYTIEIVEPLAVSAKQKLARYENVTVRHGDGYKGWLEEAPFDRIMLTAAPPELPAALLEQLKPGGKLIAPVGRTVFDQELVLVEKAADGTMKQRSILPVRFVPMVPGKE